MNGYKITLIDTQLRMCESVYVHMHVLKTILKKPPWPLGMEVGVE